MSRTVPPDEWIELVSDVENGRYDVDVIEGDVDLKRSASPPSQQSDGILAWAGANLPFDFDGSTNKKLWARANGDSDATVRVNAGTYPRKQRRDSRTTSVLAENVDTIEETRTATVSGGGYSDTFDFSPPEGYIWDVVGLKINIRQIGAATTGVHEVMLSAEKGAGPTVGFLYGKSNYNTDLEFNFGTWQSADSQQTPTTETAQVQMMKGIRLDSENVLDVLYTNSTDAAQDKDRFFDLRVRELRVA